MSALADVTKTFNSCEDSHCDFYASLCGEVILIYIYGVYKGKRHFRFYVVLTNVHVFFYIIELS